MMINLSEPFGLTDSGEYILCTPGKKVSELSYYVQKDSRFDSEYTNCFVLYEAENGVPFHNDSFEEID